MAERQYGPSKGKAGSPEICPTSQIGVDNNGYQGLPSEQQIHQQQQQSLILDTVAKELLELNEAYQDISTDFRSSFVPVSSKQQQQQNSLEKNNADIKSHSPSVAGSTSSSRSKTPPIPRALFPPGCMTLLHNLPGNSQCVDCGASNPTWASISYGILLCLHCSGRHRHFGVNHSKVRSVTMDSWENPSHVLSMLEGGNDQWKTFLRRHDLDSHLGVRNGSTTRPEGKGVYQTKAALFYRENLQKHVQKVLSAGTYEGRHVWRENRQQKKVRSRPTTPKRQPD